MKLPGKCRRAGWSLAGALAATACAGQGSVYTGTEAGAVRSITNGPEDDYPVVVGEPYSVGATRYVPLDTLNYDEVGYVAGEAMAEPGVVAAHHTLPLPSYVEVTSLDSGKTALVRVERRGPMDGNALIALSPAALEQLGLARGAAVRVRRVNPQEADRAKLRADRAAPLRMDTPPGLLSVLKRRLPADDTPSVSLSDPRQSIVSGKAPDASLIASLDSEAAAAPVRAVAPPSVNAAPRPAPVNSGVMGKGFGIQLGAFSVPSNAERLAAKVGGEVVRSGRLSLVRVLGFTSRGQAEDALAKLREQGYSGATVLTLK